MAILPGLRLGPYEILSAIGAGGMGEVYRAKDTRLDRIVAIKVLPARLADSSELRERFEREARTIASLNHPHICTLYDIGHQDGTDFLVMEYLEGETLAQRLVKGPLPLDQVLQYAIEIADALDKAHRKGVTHRDLKPGNIILTKTGTKLLDFGLAKLKQEVAPANVQLSQLPTANDPLTAQGTIVGTLQYMAPEQLEGKEVDSRTDIFAFGSVVYEMATGKRAFEGKSQASLIAKILSSDPPPISSLQPMTPPALDRVVKRCLAKEPDQRWQTSSDLSAELKWIAESGSQAVTMPVGKSFRRRIVWAVAAVFLVVVAAVASIATWVLKPADSAPTRPVSRLIVTLPPGDRLALQNYNNPVLALSPDGSRLAYVAVHGGQQLLYVRRLDSLEASALPGTEGCTNPFFSPDAQWLGFFADGKLKKISVGGGATVTLASAITPRGASWGTEGTIAFVRNTNSVIEQVSDDGGSVRPLSQWETGEIGQSWPEYLPDGSTAIFIGGRKAQITHAGQASSLLVDGAADVHFARSGHLLYAQDGTLMAVPFDPQREALSGKAVPVVQGVVQSPNTGAAQFSVSESGSLAYVAGGVQGQRKLVWVSRNGAEQLLAAPPRPYSDPKLSPDGRTIAMEVLDEGPQIWLYSLDRNTLTRFTFGGNTASRPVWTPDGKAIAFLSNQGGPLGLFLRSADGSQEPERLTNTKIAQFTNSFSPDGQTLAFAQQSPTTGFDIWVLRLADRKVEPFVKSPFNETTPRFSPDGHWLAYVSDESGRSEVYAQPYPGPGGKLQLSVNGGTEPNWSANGRELFYRTGDKMMTVEIKHSPGFSAAEPKILFTGDYVPATNVNYDVSADGQRFLMVKESEPSASLTQIVVVQNWFEELKQKVPSGKK